ncbi:cation:proton antiporter [Thermomonas carbonis]|nr:cation:proton antiporter [Thermomonas carbonis]GHC01810.1 cation transporter [Thermomonas carbonis]
MLSEVDPYIGFLLGIGGMVLLASWAPLGLKRLPMPMTLPIVCVALGAFLFGNNVFSGDPSPRTWDTMTERMTELVVIVSLMGAGLKLDRPLGWRRWGTTWRLLAIAMPLTIAATAWLGMVGLGFPLALALLFGASMAPTDPVLASDVQVGPPGKGDGDEVRFGLTSEAGLNDALAFPFVHLAILVAAGGLGGAAAIGEWFGIYVVWKLLAGLGMGLLVGRAMGFLIFSSRRGGLSRHGDGLVALAATLIAYAATEMAHGYGFLAVFVCALTMRARERHHEFHEELHHFSDQVERLLMLLLLVLFGGALARGLLDALTLQDALVCLAILLLVRPLAGMLAMAGSPHPPRERWLLAFLGIRGIGSMYYVAYGINHGSFGDSERLWAAVGFLVLASIVTHGLSSDALLRRLARRRAQADPAA